MTSLMFALAPDGSEKLVAAPTIRRDLEPGTWYPGIVSTVLRLPHFPIRPTRTLSMESGVCANSP
jgi:hypothetical protein